MKKLYTLFTLLFTLALSAQDLVITVAVPSGTTACRIGGPWWGWDPNGGPVGVDNGNDTFTFTFSPAPTADMEYLFVLNGTSTYENLINNAQNAECTDRVTNGNINTDYSNYANRIWKTTDGLVWNETYDNCAYYALSNSKQSKLDFSMFPNPAEDWLRVSSEETITGARVYDLKGRLVLQKTPNARSFELRTNGLSKGIYIMKLDANDRVATRKFVNN